MSMNNSQSQLSVTQALLKRVVSFSRAVQLSEEFKSQGKRIVFTSGCFDILHTAHLHYLQHLKEVGDVLIVGVDSNSSVKKLKGEDHPFFDEQERTMLLANVRCVDYVFAFDGVWEVADLLKLGADYVGVPPFDPNMEDKVEKIRLAKCELVITPPFLRSDSSSRKAKILKNDYLSTNLVS